MLIDEEKNEILLKEMQSKGEIGLEEFLEWIYIQDKFIDLEKLFKEKFDAEKVEHFRFYGCFKIPFEKKLSEIFSLMEKIKEEKGIMNYSIK